MRLPSRPVPVVTAVVLLVLVVAAAAFGGPPLVHALTAPDPDAEGYVSSRWHTERYPFRVSGQDEQAAGVCVHWVYRGQIAAQVRWEGTAEDARVELRRPRIGSLTVANRLTRGCEDGAEEVPSPRVALYAEAWGDDDTTCGWTPTFDGSWDRPVTREDVCADSGRRAEPSRFRDRSDPGSRFSSSWSPAVAWLGEAGADAGGAGSFDDSLCFGGFVGSEYEFELSPEAGGSDVHTARVGWCVDLWQPTPWGPQA